MEPFSALTASSEAISLVSALVELVKTMKDEGEDSGTSPTLRELLGRLQVEAVALSRNLENRLRHLVENLNAYGMNPQLSIDDHLRKLSWYNVVKRSRIKSLREECLAIYRQLTSFIDDATAVLICENRIEVASDAFAASLATKRQLDELFLRRNVPLKDILDGLLATASRVSSDLQSA